MAEQLDTGNPDHECEICGMLCNCGQGNECLSCDSCWDRDCEDPIADPIADSSCEARS